jgi:hypothetical protein
MIQFNRLEVNEDTNCLEAFLEGESEARVEIPLGSREPLDSLIKLLLDYAEDEL